MIPCEWNAVLLCGVTWRLSTVLSDQTLHRDSMPCDETFDRPASAVYSVTASRVRLLTVRQISLSRE